MEYQQVVDGLPLEAERAGKLGVAVERVAIGGQGNVERGVALGERPRDGVLDLTSGREIFKVVTNGRLIAHERLPPRCIVWAVGFRGRRRRVGGIAGRRCLYLC